MSNNHLSSDSDLPPPRSGPSRRYPWAIVVVVILFVIVPFISWYGSWFGRALSDAKMEEYLHDQNKPRNVQHALGQIADRIIGRDQSVKKFYPEVIAASQHGQSEVRATAAWVMGQDNSYQDFHPALLALLEESSPGVRHNAALALVSFGDSTARRELVAMLKPYTVRAEGAGVVELIAKAEGSAVAAHAPLARIRQADGPVIELRAPEAGRVEIISVADGASVEVGRELMTLSPPTDQVWEALRALYLIGQPDDIAFVQRYTRPIATMPDRIPKQALSTIEAIRERASRMQ